MSARCDWRTKRYGQLTGEQLERCIAVFREVWSERQSWKELAKDEEKATKFLTRLVEVPNWVAFYNYTLLELVARIVIVSGAADKVIASASSSDPVAAMLNVVENLPDEPPEHPDSMPLAFAMVGNLDAIALYSRSINDMLVACREQGDLNAALDALSVDSYLSTMPIFQSLMRLGQLSDDPEAVEEIFRRVKGPHKKRLEYPELRWVEYLLRDQGAFLDCTRDEIYELVVEHLQLYDAAGDKEDPKAGLFKLFRAWQKQAGIQKPRFGFSAKGK